MATGKYHFTQNRKDVALLNQSPALMGPDMDGWLNTSFMPMASGILHSSAQASFSLPKAGQFGLGASWVNYGEMQGYEATGQASNSFSASSYAIRAQHARFSGPFSLGLALGYAGEHIETYSQSALFLDISSIYEHPEKDLRLGLLVRNLGVVFGNQAGLDRLPLDSRLGLSYRLEHLPLRLSLTYHHLHQWDITYLDPNLNESLSLQGQNQTKNASWIDQFSRHFSIGSEFLISKSITLLAGYDHLTRREMQLPEQIGAMGFSLGGELKIRYFGLQLGHAWHHSAGNFTRFALSTDLKGLF